MKYLLVYLLQVSICTAQVLDEYRIPESAVQCDDGTCAVVIAIDGLKLRDTSSLSGHIIERIPFSEKVEVLENLLPVKDEMIDSIHGFWKKVQYKGKTGYAFSSYLSYGINKMDEQFYFLIPNGSCGDNNYFSLQYNYYGFYKVDFHDGMEIRKIKPIFYSEDVVTTIKADSFVQPEFFIASMDTITSGFKICSYSNANLFSIPEYNYSRGKKMIGLTNGELLLDVENYFFSDDYQKLLYLVDPKTNQKQLIGTSYFSFQLFWDGDLDNDGKTDFIIFIGKEHGGFYELFLSGKAKKGDFVKKVASFQSGDCC